MYTFLNTSLCVCVCVYIYIYIYIYMCVCVAHISKYMHKRTVSGKVYEKGFGGMEIKNIG